MNIRVVRRARERRGTSGDEIINAELIRDLCRGQSIIVRPALIPKMRFPWRRSPWRRGGRAMKMAGRCYDGDGGRRGEG